MSFIRSMGFFSRPTVSVLMVCTANICRSPMAEGILRERIKQHGLQKKVAVDSAGTHAAQLGRLADPRAQSVCSAQGISLKKLRARQIKTVDFERFDFVLAMDASNYSWLLKACPEHEQHKISLAGAWTETGPERDIPDPYYGNLGGFSLVYGLLDDAINGFIKQNLLS